MNTPLLARLILRVAAPRDCRDETIGDLEEAHARRRSSGRLVAWCVTVGEAVVVAVALLTWRVQSAGALVVEGLRRPSAADLRLGLRLMGRQPVATITAGVSLAVGIALVTAGFAFMEAVLFSRLPFEGGDRYVRLGVLAAPGQEPVALTRDDYRLIAGRASAFEHVGAFAGGRENARLPTGELDSIATAGITPTSLARLGRPPLIGRLLTSGDGLPGATPVAIVSESFWRRRLGGEEAIVGSTIDVGSTPRVVVGVARADLQFPSAPDLWWPMDERFLRGDGAPDSDARLFAVLVPGRSIADAREQLRVLTADLGRGGQGDEAPRIDVTGFTDLGPMAAVLAGSVVTLLVAMLVVIASNVANLVLARSLARTPEFAVRTALGASRARIVGQVFGETMLVTAIAALVGGVGARAVMRQFNTMDEIPFWVDFGGGPLSIALVALSAFLAAALAGAWPAWRATRGGLTSALLSGAGRSTDLRFGRLATTLLVVQVALSVVMLHGAIVMAEGYARYTSAPSALAQNVLTAQAGLNAVRPAGPGQAARPPITASELRSIAAGVPGVASAGLSTALPGHSPSARRIEIEGAAGPEAVSAAGAVSAGVTDGLIEALGGAPLAGRLFGPADLGPNAAPVAVVNAPFVDRFFAGGPAIGRRFRTLDGEQPGAWREVVGVVPDLGLSLGDPTFAAGFYEPLGPDENFVYVALRSAGDAPQRLAGALREAVLVRDPELFLAKVTPLGSINEDRPFFAVFAGVLVGIGALTMVLALAGLYAMMSLVVTRRTREIGIRLALGATPRELARAIAGRAVLQVGLGAILGVVLARGAVGARGIFASRLGDGGAWALPVVVALLLLAGLAATWWPLRRAIRVRPVDALRVG